MKKLSLSAFFLIIAFISISSPTLAQTADRKYYGIIINPAMKEYQADPGDDITGIINLTNDFQHQEDVHYYPHAINFTQDGETGNPKFFINPNLPDSINPMTWISFEEDKYDIEFGERINSNYIINVPEDAEPGGYYVTLLYNTKEEFGDENVGLDNEIGALIFIIVSGDTSETGEAIEFFADKNVYEFTPTTLTTRYKNNGNIHTAIGGDIFIHKNDITNPIATLEVNAEGELTLPNNIRSYYEIYNEGFMTFEDGKIKFDTEQFPKILFGKYTATLKLRHTVDGERITTEMETSFWVIPWRLIIIIVSWTLALILIIFKRRKKPNMNPNYQDFANVK